MMELWYYNDGIVDPSQIRKSLFTEEFVAADAERTMAKDGVPGFSIYFFKSPE